MRGLDLFPLLLSLRSRRRTYLYPILRKSARLISFWLPPLAPEDRYLFCTSWVDMVFIFFIALRSYDSRIHVCVRFGFRLEARCARGREPVRLIV